MLLPVSFGTKLSKVFATQGQLCVGIDPHQSQLDSWGLPDSVSGLEQFANTVLEAAIGRVGVIKPQVSFFERHGSAGLAVLERVLEKANSAGLLTIMDIKRGDIGSTMDAYFDAWLGKSAPFICDAVTVSPYLGFDSLQPFFAAAVERGKGVIVLAATSNIEGAALQRAIVDESTVAASVWSGLNRLNSVTGVPGSVGSFGAVIGATLKLKSFGLGSVLTEQPAIPTPILAPGFGAQGAKLDSISNLFGESAANVIASVSRSISDRGPQLVDDAIDQANREIQIGLAD